MPRGQKSKLRSREKRRQAREETRSRQDAQATAAAAEESPSSVSSVLGDSSQNLPTAGTGNAPDSPERAAGVSGADSDEGAMGPSQESPSSSQASESSWEDPLNEQVISLVWFLLRKYHENLPITKGDILKFVNEKYESHFPEILKKISEHMEPVFGVTLTEVDPIRHWYTFVSKLDLTAANTDEDGENTPESNLLMVILSVIFMKRNSATEEKVWEVLNMMQIYAGIKHHVYGEPKKFITQELVQKKYLEYRQVPNSDPPRYEFLWGPRAHSEIGKMKVLKFVAQVNDTTPSDFPSWYKEALKDEEEKALARIEARVPSSAKVAVCSKAKPSSSSCTK